MKFREYQKFKLSFDDPQYSDVEVLESGKMRITCRIEAAINFPMLGNVRFVTWPFNVTGVGVATCSENDAFDLEIGKRVARAKAESSAYRQINKRINKALKQIEDLSVEFNDKTFAVEDHNWDYIDSITAK